MSDDHPYTSLPMIVVTGVGRSGTTALRKALGCHPDVLSTGHEHNIVYDILETARRNRSERSRRLAMQVTDTEHNDIFRKLILDLIFPRPERDTWNKSVLLYTNLFPDTAQYLLELFPNAKIVCIVRNGVETLCSRIQHEYLGSHTFEKQCRFWKNADVMARWSQSTDRCLTVRHEVMKADQQGFCDQIMEFCPLTPSLAPAQHLQETTHHPTKPVHSGGWNRWTPEQRRTFEELCGFEMQSLGYEIPWKDSSALRAS